MNDITDFEIKAGVLTKYKGKVPCVVIPDGVTGIGYEAFSYREDIISVSIPDGVTNIGESAFCGCKSLVSINIPDSVTSIGDNAFFCCSKLLSITLPDSVTTVGEDVFRLCEKMADENGFVIVKGVLYDYYGTDSEVTIPNSVTSIGRCAFFNSLNMVSVTIPDSIKTIGYKAFEFCKNLQTINLPENIELYENSVIETIWEHFRETDYKISVMYELLKQYPDFVVNNTSISKKVKANAKSLFDIILENDDVEIVELLFSLYKKISLDTLNEYLKKAQNTINIKAFILNYRAESYSVERQKKHENDNIEKTLGFKKRTLSDWKKIYSFKVSGENVTITGYKGNDTDVLVPEKIGKYNVVAIDVGAFSPQMSGISKETKRMRQFIRSVVIPDSVTNIARGTFCGCVLLASVILPKNITSIGWGMFGNCMSLTSVNIPDSVTSIAGLAFCNCTNLTSITIPDKVMSIGERAFLDCSSLKSVKLSHKVLSVGEKAFSGCKALADEDGFVALNGVLYNYYGSGCNITIPAKTEIIEKDAFRCCDSIEIVTMPDSVNSIGECAFYCCENLKSIRIPKYVKSIDRNVFAGCVKLEKVTIVNSMTEINAYAFKDCPDLAIYARSGSCAEKYAKKNNISFVKK